MKVLKNLLLGFALASLSKASAIPHTDIREENLAPFIGAVGNDTLPGEYIITLKDDQSLPDHFEAIGRDLSSDNLTAFTWWPHANAYHATNLTSTHVYQIRQDPGVESVLEVEFFSVGGSVSSGPSEDLSAWDDDEGPKLKARSKSWFPDERKVSPWHLQAVSAGSKVSNVADFKGPAYQMYYNQKSGNGQGVNIYVVDSGMNIDHPYFEGRASNFAKCYTNLDGDCYKDYTGHGTAVGGLAVGKVVGTAQGANVTNVKCFYNAGKAGKRTNMVWVNSALQDILNDHLAKLKDKPSGWTGSVVNLSWGDDGNRDSSTAKLINNMYYAGMTVVVSAGNFRDSGVSADSTWPCNMNTICVGAINKNYEQDWYSNTGGNVTVLAPGTDVYTLDYDRTSIHHETGTSFASPIVAGIVAGFVGWEDMSNGDVDDVNKARARLAANMLTNILGDKEGSSNLDGSDNNFATNGIRHKNRKLNNPYVGVGDVIESSTYIDYNPFGFKTVTGEISLYGMAATATHKGATTTDAGSITVSINTAAITNESAALATDDPTIVFVSNSTTPASTPATTPK